MAYQINGNVIIDDSGNGLFENLVLVHTPVNLDPTDTEGTYGSNIALIFTNFASVYSNVGHSYTVFEVANASSFASANIVHSGNVSGSNTVYFDSNVSVDTFYWRVKNVDENGNNSKFSKPTSFDIIGLTPPPDGLGCPYLGGYFVGNIDIGGGVCYHLVLAPQAEGYCSSRQWKTSCTYTPATSFCNGYTNTYPHLDNGTHPAGNFASTLSISGYSDWYLPARDEMIAMQSSASCLPGGETWVSGDYWTSTQRLAGNAADQGDFAYFGTMPSGGFPNNGFKIYNKKVRAARRVPLVV